MSNIDVFLLLLEEHNRLQDIKKYDDLTKEFEDIQAKVIQSNNLTKKDEIKLQSNLINHWKRIISDACSDLTSKIDTRKIRVQLFSGLKNKIGKLWAENEKKKLSLYDCHNIWTKLEKLAEDIKERIRVEKHQLWLFFGGLVIGFILGILASIIVKII